MYIPFTFRPRSPPPFASSVNQFECICVCNELRSIVLYFAICKSVVRQLPVLLLALLRCGFCKLSRHGHGVVVVVEEEEIHLFSYFILKLSQPSSSSSSITVNREFAQLVRRNESFVQIVIFTSPSFSSLFSLNLKNLHNKTQTNKTQLQTNQAHKHFTQTQTYTQFTRKICMTKNLSN